MRKTIGASNYITNLIGIKNRRGTEVAFEATNHYDASSDFSDTVDLPVVGYIYIKQAGDIAVILEGADTSLVYTFDIPGIYPLKVKRILSTGTTVTNVYILS